MAVGDIYKLVQAFTLGGVEALIRRWYRAKDSTVNAADLAYQWNEDVAPILAVPVTDDMLFKDVTVENLNNSADFAVLTQNDYPGGQVDEWLPPWVSYGFQFPSSDKKLRAGLCRLPGLTESCLIDGSLNPAYNSVLDTCALWLAEPLVNTYGTFDPVLYTDGNSRTADNPFYVYIEDGFFSRITSQNSRKT
jgi:hypothetical protein